ncbi:MAG: hypothetical protein H7259_08810, partial [Cytophagales bacterium]|nr:hypothetical protein [Cytophaga sp.]
MKHILFFIWFTIAGLLGAIAQTNHVIVNKVDDISSIVSASTVESINQRLENISANSPYNVVLVFQQSPVRVTKNPADLSAADLQQLSLKIRKDNKKDFDNIPVIGSGQSVKKNIVVFYNLKFYNKPDKNGSLENFFCQTVVVTPTINSFIKTSLTNFKQTSKLISGTANISANETHINAWLTNLDKILADPNAAQNDNYQLGPLIVTIPKASIKPSTEKKGNLTKYTSTDASINIALKSTAYKQLDKKLEHVSISYYYDEDKGEYDQVQITMSGVDPVYLADINILKTSIKDINLNVTAAGVFSGYVLLQAPVAADTKLNTLLVLKPGFAGTFKFNYTASTTDFTGSYNFSSVTDVKIDVAKFGVSIGTIQGPLLADGSITQSISVANKQCGGTFYTLEFNTFNANITYSVFGGVKINSCNFDGAVSSLVGLSGKIG